MYTNALANEKSPYLRQHAHNPVDWLPWGTAAFEKARRENKPIFLSIGYSTCHWCHVMAHESFEDENIAEILNRHFVPIKVDREERPDVDRIYMLFVQASTGSGGWPMSVFLTPDLKPFFGGTYFPPGTRYGRPGFRDLLLHLAHAWQQQRSEIEESSVSATEQLRSLTLSAKAAFEPDRELFNKAFWQFRRSFDTQWGGFGGAPKFPRPVVFNYLLRYFAAEKSEDALDMVTKTLRMMAAGGMHDQLGGGFHRYSVDERWFVPHFEKMLYDQAQLAVSYVETYQITKEPVFADTARDVFTYLLRDMTAESGAFYSAEDADSPDPEDPSKHGEGAFYVWRQSEVEDLLGPKAALFCAHFGVEPDGNVEQDPHGEFTGRNILFQAKPIEKGAEQAVEDGKRTLFAKRRSRPRPHLDDKILTSWNALMISALAQASAVLREPLYLQAAEKAAAFLLQRMYDEQSGQLLRVYCEGEAGVSAFSDDYAFFAQALLDLFEGSGNGEYLRTAINLCERGLRQFEDEEGGGFFSTPEDAPDILMRIKDDYDGAEPSANSIAADVLLRLAHLTGNDDFRRRGERALRSFAPKLQAQPTMAPQMVVALGRWLAQPEQIVIRCAELDDEAREWLYRKRTPFAPYSTVLPLTDAAAETLRGAAPFLSGLERKGRLTIYECRNFTCELPQIVQ
ncbi:MAG: thioredoxin domain-containing protein [Acidobacteriaceae bacterium]|nr:thioredoxin domain-containing protein [Acidobacteriaceae bacterium]